jgi:hypothetical protein
VRLFAPSSTCSGLGCGEFLASIASRKELWLTLFVVGFLSAFGAVIGRIDGAFVGEVVTPRVDIPGEKAPSVPCGSVLDDFYDKVSFAKADIAVVELLWISN